MKETTLVLIIWSIILIAFGILYWFFMRSWEKKHPNIFTSKATPKEKAQYKQLILLFFCWLFSMALALSIHLCEGTPILLYIMLALCILYIVVTMIKTKK